MPIIKPRDGRTPAERIQESLPERVRVAINRLRVYVGRSDQTVSMTESAIGDAEFIREELTKMHLLPQMGLKEIEMLVEMASDMESAIKDLRLKRDLMEFHDAITRDDESDDP